MSKIQVCKSQEAGHGTRNTGHTHRTHTEPRTRPQTKLDIWICEMNAIFYFIYIIIIITVRCTMDHRPWTMDHTHTNPRGGENRTHTSGQFLVLWVVCQPLVLKGGCNQSADINIFRVANRKLLRLSFDATTTTATATATYPLPK